jgi:putative transposase
VKGGIVGRLSRKEVLYNGGYYHVYTRGNDRRRLFRTAEDHRFFLETVEEYQDKFPVGVVHYCLMPNHVHFMVKAEIAMALPKFMKTLLQVYAFYFRRKYHSVGHVFQDRYRSIAIKNEAYLLECGRYIERNPLRAGLTTSLEDYRWSSYHFYVNGAQDAAIKFCDPLYLYLDNAAKKRMEFYRKLFAEERLYEHLVDDALGIK